MKNQMYKCKCGGQVGFNFEHFGIAHTFPTCQPYDKLDVDKLIQVEGALGAAIFNMQEKPSA